MNQLRPIPADNLRTRERAPDEDFSCVIDGVVHLHHAAHLPSGSLDGVINDDDQVVDLEIFLGFRPLFSIGQQRDVVGDPCLPKGAYSLPRLLEAEAEGAAFIARGVVDEAGRRVVGEGRVKDVARTQRATLCHVGHVGRH